MYRTLVRLFHDQQGVTSIEYGAIGLILATALALIIGDSELGFISTLTSVFEIISDAFDPKQ